MLLLSTPLELIGNWLLGWLNGYPELKLVSIMVVIPFIFNAIQFWIQDNILKADKKKNIIFVTRGRLLRSRTMKPSRSANMLGIDRSSKKANSISVIEEKAKHFELHDDEEEQDNTG